MIIIGEYGWKIRNYKAATIYGKNIGLREKYDYTPAMLHHSLFTRYLKANGMQTDKNDESTRDIICIDFQFGLRSYSEEIGHLNEMRRKAEQANDQERLAKIQELYTRAESKKDLYKKISKSELREIMYNEGADITYTKFENGEYVVDEIIHYKMLYRNPSKAKEGSSMWIRAELYDAAYAWITMGIGARLPATGARIVEMSAYMSLTASAIEGTIHLPIDDVLLVKDQDSFFKTIADVVRAEDYVVYEKPKRKKDPPREVIKKKCVVCREETNVKNTLWDGMALIESTALPPWCNGMALLRNHFFKACAFKTRLQLFFQDYCAKNNLDYNTFEVTDMFGRKHRAADIKMIVSDNGPKIWKFAELIGQDASACQDADAGQDAAADADASGSAAAAAYDYWRAAVAADGNIWGIVKTDHPSKLGKLQRLSYQMINSLPCTKEDVYKITQTSVDYIGQLRNNNDELLSFLRKNANVANSNEMLVALCEHNPDITKTAYFKTIKKYIIKNYIFTLRNGKIQIPGDNLTVCGNPYALLLFAAGEDWAQDPTLVPEEGTIQCYAPRFEDGEYLCGIRNPHNSANNLGYFHNVKHPYMEKYMDFSNNIIAVNCIGTDIQARMNGEDSIGSAVWKRAV